ncbi:MAG: hypothetical protein V7637_1225 [Mycobacteriales bacterium]|jgi:hypothetical protein
MRTRTIRRVTAVVAVIGITAGLIAAGVHFLLDRLDLPAAQVARCDLVGSPYSVSTEQAANAATITAAAVRRKLPTQAAVIALATALQESKLVNVEYGDRDSVGLFQQRPSQGWGTANQILDPRYAAGKFYDHLVKVKGWQTRPVTEAAQAVQHSGHPMAYAQWEDQATVLARAFAGSISAGVSCAFPEPTVVAQPAKVVALLAQDLPTTRLATSDHAAELRPATPAWASVSWLVAHADQLGVDAVSYAGQRWSRLDGWRDDGTVAPDRVRLETAQLRTPSP